MKSMGKLLRTLSGDGMSPRSSGGASRRTRSPHRSGRAQLRRNKTMENRPHTPPPRDAQIYCNDMYTVDYVLNSIEDVAQNAMIDTIVLEDLIERNHERITKTVLDLFVESTQSASLEQDSGHNGQQGGEQSTDKLRGSTSTASTTFHSSLSMGANNSGSFHNSSKHMRSSRKNRNSKKNNKKPVIERRVWKKIVFVDCISDSYAYERYLDSKRDFVASLTRFLRMKGFQNDLPIRFEAKIEIHTLLEAPTILQLLQAIQQDTTVTRVEFGGALGHTERRVPEEFEKLIDPDTVTVKEMVKIHLHYDKQSLNIDEDDILDDGPSKGIKGASISQRKGKQRRTSQLDPGVLMTIQRCAIILERKMLPEDGMGSSEFLLDASELSESMEGSRRGARPSYLDQRPSYLAEKDDDSSSDAAKAIPLSRYTSDYATDTEEAARPLGMLTADEEESSRFLESSSSASSPKLQQRRESPKRREEPLRMVDNSEPGVRRRQEGSGASAGFKRAHTVEGCRPRSSSPSNPYGAKPKTPVRRAHTVDDSFWDGGLENGKDNDGSNNSTEQQWMEEWAASAGGRNSKPKIGKYKRQSEEKKLLTPPESPATSPTSIRKKSSWATPPASPSIDSAEHGSPSRPSRVHRKSRSPDRSSLGDSSRKHHHHTNGVHDNDSKEKKVSDDSVRDDKSERKKDKKMRDHSMVDESERSSRSRKKDKKEKKAMKDHSSLDHSERSSRKKKDKKKKKKKESDEASLNGHSGHSTDTHKSDKSSKKKKKKDPEESSSLNGHSSHSTGSKSKHNNKKNLLPDNPSRAAPTTAVSEHSPLSKKKKKVRNPRDAPEGLAPPTLRRVASDTPPKDGPASVSVSSVAADPPGSSKRRMRRTQSFSGRGSTLMGGFDWNCFLGESTTNGLIDP